MIDFTWLKALELLGIGIGAGFYGSMVGLGGGFVVVPMLLLLYHLGPQQTVGTSLAVVFLNAVSGTLAFARQRRIDYKTGIKFGLATLPGAVLGAYAANFLSPRVFSFIFGVLLVGVAIFLVVRPKAEAKVTPGLSCAPLLSHSYVTRTVVDANGKVFRYVFRERLGVVISFFVGFISSILGIGGGIIHVPAMVYLFSFPVHIATATSMFILGISSMAGSAFHFALGHVLYLPALAIGVGAILGAQGGARLSQRLKAEWLIRALSPAFLFAGVRLLMAWWR